MRDFIIPQPVNNYGVFKWGDFQQIACCGLNVAELAKSFGMYDKIFALEILGDFHYA